MIFKRKIFRYYYWLGLEFVKKHLRIILLSFLITFVFIIGFISFSPYLETFFLTRSNVIGMIGTYDINSLPDDITKKISSGLLFVNEKGQFLPAIASSWEIVNNGKEYRFHIREGLIWSDGKNFTTKDLGYKFMDVETKILDDKTVYFILKKEIPIFPTYLTKPILKYPLIGVAGLYKVDQIKSKYGNITELSLSPNKKEYPFLIYKFYNNEVQLVNAYKRGEINQMIITKKSIADVFSNWKNSTIIKNVDYTKLLTMFFSFDNQLLQQKEIRQAIEMAIDRNNFINFGQLAQGPIAPTSWAFNPNLKPFVYDNIAAEKIIKKTVGATESAQLNLYTYYDYLNDAETIINDLNKVGLNVNLNVISSEKPNSFDLLLAFWNVQSDPDQYFFWHSTQAQGNLGGYKNIKIDKLLEDGRNTSAIEDRKKIYLDFQKNIIDDPPAVFIYYPYVYTIKRK